jgi:hypothetical protein
VLRVHFVNVNKYEGNEDMQIEGEYISTEFNEVIYG